MRCAPRPVPRSRHTSTSSSARCFTTSGRRSRCCCSRASTCSASRGCGSRRRRSIFALWRRPWRTLARLERDAPRDGLLAWGALLAAMNCCFYEAIDRLPLATVAAIEFLPVIALAAIGARTRRNAAALALAVPGVYLLTGRRARDRAARPRVRVRQRGAVRRLHRARAPVRREAPAIDGHRRARRRDADRGVVVTPIGGWQVTPRVRPTRSRCSPASASGSPPR